MSDSVLQPLKDSYEQLMSIIGLQLSSESLNSEFQRFVGTPETKAYSDVVYFNYFGMGLSLVCSPSEGYQPHAHNLDTDKLRLQSIDIYNNSTGSTGSGKSYQPCPLLPLHIATPGDGVLEITAATKGKEFVEVLGEPTRKGGGEGPSSGSIGIWCEWSKQGLMVEFESSGPQAWDKGKDIAWKVITLFSPNNA